METEVEHKGDKTPEQIAKEAKEARRTWLIRAFGKEGFERMLQEAKEFFEWKFKRDTKEGLEH